MTNSLFHAALFALAAHAALGSVPAGGQTTERVSVSSSGTEGSGVSYSSDISADGRFVAFWSAANNLVTGDTNGAWDVFVHDRTTGVTKRVSVNSSGTQGNDYSYSPTLSADGRLVAFHSYAKNLVSGDTNGASDIFVHDRTTGVTKRVSVNSSGTQGNDYSYATAISAGGRFVAFTSIAGNLVAGDSNGDYDVFVHDLTTGVTERVSVNSSSDQGNRRSFDPTISSDGRFVAFESYANNLVTGDTNGDYDIFVHDRTTGVTKRVSVSSSGDQGFHGSFRPAISADGRFVTFESIAKNLVTGDTNGVRDIFVHDRTTGVTKRVNVSSSGDQANRGSFDPAISSDGRFVAFTSSAGNLVPGDTNGDRDIFVHDRTTGVTKRVSVTSDGSQVQRYKYHPSISGDGRFVVFDSPARDLVNGDTNEKKDVFVRDRGP